VLFTLCEQGLYLDFKVSKYLLIFYPFIYGIVILFLFFHANEEEIVTEIIRFELPYYYINEIFIISAFLFISVSGYFYWKFESIREKYVSNCFSICLCNHIQNFQFRDLHFIIWHSIPSILDQIKFIYGSFLLAILYPIARTPLCTGWLLNRYRTSLFFV
jgi:hypothetical protein